MLDDPVASSGHGEDKRGKLFLCGNSCNCSEPVWCCPQADSEKPLKYTKRCADIEQPWASWRNFVVRYVKPRL